MNGETVPARLTLPVLAPSVKMIGSPLLKVVALRLKLQLNVVASQDELWLPVQAFVPP